MNRKELQNRIIAVIFGIFLSVLIIEIALFLLDKPHFYKVHSHPAQFAFLNGPDNNLICINAPSRCIRFIYDGNPRGYFGRSNEVDHITNSSGFRGPEFSQDKPRGTLRIVFLGDSFTFGEGVNFADTYPELVAAFLNKKYKSLPIHFESYNFGVGGYNTSQSLHLLRNVALRTNPDIVVLGYTLNDAEPPLFETNKRTGQIFRRPRENDIPEGLSDALPPKKLIYKLRIAKLLWRLQENKKCSLRTVSYYRSLFQEANPAWQDSRNSLHGIIELCHSKGIPCYIVLFPILYQLNNKYPFFDIHSLIRKEAIDGKAGFIDLYPYLAGQDARKLWVHPVDQHPNELVHAIAARVLAGKIVSNDSIEAKISKISKGD